MVLGLDLNIATTLQVQSAVSAWLTQNWDPSLERLAWQKMVIDARLAAPTWKDPIFGAGASIEQARAIYDQFAAFGARGTAHDKRNLWANTLVAYGTPELKSLLLASLLCEETKMCLLYSEPCAGSDLAAIQTSAVADGDQWIINGQKVWTSGASNADYGMLIARTNPDVPKHSGISFFFLPMKQSGVEIRAIQQITGESHFNEVFIDNAVVPNTHRLGALGDGWKVLQTALTYERAVMGNVARGPKQAGIGERDPNKDTPGKDSVANKSAVEIDLWALARERGVDNDPNIRQALARLHTLRKVNEYTQNRAKAALAQGTSSSKLSLGKLAMSKILHYGAYVHAQILGTEATLVGPDYPDASDANFLALNAYFTSIGGGTDQIQRNIIGERLLGLPKEPEPDKHLAFKDVRKANITPR